MFECVMLGIRSYLWDAWGLGWEELPELEWAPLTLWAATQSFDREGAEEGAEASDMMEGDS